MKKAIVTIMVLALLMGCVSFGGDEEDKENKTKRFSMGDGDDDTNGVDVPEGIPTPSADTIKESGEGGELELPF